MNSNYILTFYESNKYFNNWYIFHHNELQHIVLSVKLETLRHKYTLAQTTRLLSQNL